MHSPVKSLFIVVLALFVVLATLDVAEAGYRKPPFNGTCTLLTFFFLEILLKPPNNR